MFFSWFFVFVLFCFLFFVFCFCFCFCLFCCVCLFVGVFVCLFDFCFFVFCLLIPGGAVPFWRRRVCKAQKTPFFSVAVTQRPLYFYNCMCSHPKTPWFFIFFSHRMPNFAHQMPNLLTECQISLTECLKSRFLTTEPSYFCIFLSPNAKNHALTQWPLIFWACALTECPSLSERGPYTRIHFIFDCPPPGLLMRWCMYKGWAWFVFISLRKKGWLMFPWTRWIENMNVGTGGLAEESYTSKVKLDDAIIWNNFNILQEKSMTTFHIILNRFMNPFTFSLLIQINREMFIQPITMSSLITFNQIKMYYVR